MRLETSIRQDRSLVLTGASDFIGKAVLEAACEKYHVFALARHSRKEAGVRESRNVDWILFDIADVPRLTDVFTEIHAAGGADDLLHLAGYYTFENVEHPEFRRTNVEGTRNLLEQARRLELRRFVFASSLVVSRFPPPGDCLTEKSPADAEFPYARSKKEGEELLRTYSRSLPCSVVRLAATFSDWCEYGPFYMLSERWNARILAGTGSTAQPLDHIDCVVDFFLEVLNRSESLPDFDIYALSSRESYSHRQLFELATRLYHGKERKPLLVPKPLAGLGVRVRDLWGRTMGRRPLERPWMVN
jgi:nucleoside-diphosphate-sugar epimerase